MNTIHMPTRSTAGYFSVAIVKSFTVLFVTKISSKLSFDLSTKWNLTPHKYARRILATCLEMNTHSSSHEAEWVEDDEFEIMTSCCVV